MSEPLHIHADRVEVSVVRSIPAGILERIELGAALGFGLVFGVGMALGFLALFARVLRWAFA